MEHSAPLRRSLLDKAAAILADFGTFWEIESSPAERRKLLTSLFERAWEQNGAITAVKPRVASGAQPRTTKPRTMAGLQKDP